MYFLKDKCFKILDFGFAYDFSTNNYYKGGTPAYSSPEIL